MIKYIKLLLLFLFLNPAFASYESLSEEELTKLSFNRLQGLLHSYTDFVVAISNSKYNSPKFENKDYVNNSKIYELKKFFNDQINVYASGGEICFVGGWSSKIKNSECQAPWSLASDNEIKSYGPVYDKSKSCGNKNQFRCGEVLFGGKCIDHGGSLSGIDKKCADKSGADIENLAKQIKNDPVKAKTFSSFNKAIFGPAGFCSPSNMKQKNHEECRVLASRVKSLLDPKSNGQIDANGNPIKSPKSNVAGSLGVLNACEQHLIDNSSDDVNNRGLIQSLQGGMVKCNDGKIEVPDDTFSESLKDMKAIAARFEKRKMLRKINLKSFEYQLGALLNSEFAYMHDLGEDGVSIQDKSKLKEELIKKFPKLANEEEYQKVFDNVYHNFKSISEKGKLNKVNYQKAHNNLKSVIDDNNWGVNKFCEKINKEFKEKFDNKKFVTGFEWARPYSDEENEFIAQAKVQLHQRLDYAFAKSEVGFLLGTKNFKDKVFDPTVDHTKECIQNSPTKVINANISENEYKDSLKEARQTILSSFDDLNKKEMPLAEVTNQKRSRGVSSSGQRENQADDLIKEYLKENRMVVVDTLMNETDENKINTSKYLCQKVTEIYDRDENMQIVSWVGAGASVIGGVACIFPLTAPIGCPVMWGGSAVAGVSGGSKIYEANVLAGAAEQNQATQNSRASTFNERSKAANNQLKDGVIELGGSVAGAGITGTVKGIKLVTSSAKALKASRATASVYDDGLGAAQNLAKEATYFKDPQTGKFTKRFVSSEAKINATLDDASRISSIKNRFPHLSDKQIAVILRAHNEIPCAIGACSKAQLALKMKMMKESGMKMKDYKEILRLGYAGKANPNLSQVAEDGFFSLRTPNPSVQAKLAISADHPSAAAVKALEGIETSGGGKFAKLTVDRLMPDGSVQTKTVQGYFRGSSEGKLLQFESGSEGVFAIDVNDANLIIRNIEIPQSRVVNGVMQADDYKAVFETNPMRALSKANGKQVMISVVDEEGDIIDIAGEVVMRQGKLALKSPNKYSQGQFIYTELDELEGIQKVASTYAKSSWSGAAAHPRELEESFKAGAKIKASYMTKPTYGEGVISNVEGEFLGVVTHNKEAAMAVRNSKGIIEYIPLNKNTIVDGLGEGETIFNNGVLIN